MTTPPDNTPVPLRICPEADPHTIAHDIARMLQRTSAIAVHAAGASAVFRALQGITLARAILASEGISIYLAPELLEHSTDGDELNALNLIVERQA